jgi:putative effector of murein hydrolase LrgA (UPF0299 family)
MVVCLALILLCQLLGEVFAHLTGLPLPAPVLGMLLLFGFLALRDHVSFLPADLAGDKLDQTSETLLQHMAMMFVPAGVGVVQRLDVLARYGLGIAVIIVLTTAIAIAVTAVTFRFVDRWLSPEGEGGR